MVQKCAIADCISSVKGRAAKVSLFSCPKNVEIRKKWVDVVQSVWFKLYPGEEFKLNEHFFICEFHFCEADLVRKWRAFDKAGKVVHETLYKKPRLVDGAVPQSDLPWEEFSDVELEVERASIDISGRDAVYSSQVLLNSATIENTLKRKIDGICLTSTEKGCLNPNTAIESTHIELVDRKIHEIRLPKQIKLCSNLDTANKLIRIQVSKDKTNVVHIPSQEELCLSLDATNEPIHIGTIHEVRSLSQKKVCSNLRTTNESTRIEKESHPVNQKMIRELPKPVLPTTKECSMPLKETELTVINLENVVNGTDLFKELLHRANNVKLPRHWTCSSSFGIETYIVFSQLMMIEETNFNTTSAVVPTIVKQVFFSSDLRLKSAVLSMTVDLNELLGYDKVTTIDELLEVIKKIDAMRFCHGSGDAAELSSVGPNAFVDARGKWRSKKCHKLLPSSSKIFCSECTHLRNSVLRNMRLRKKKDSINIYEGGLQTSESSRTLFLLNKLRTRIKTEQRSKNRQKLRIRLLTEKIQNIQTATKKITDKSLEGELDSCVSEQYP